MDDRQFLTWIADRFVVVHGESNNVDFVTRLRALAVAIPVGSYVNEEREYRLHNRANTQLPVLTGPIGEHIEQRLHKLEHFQETQLELAVRKAAELVANGLPNAENYGAILETLANEIAKVQK